MFGVRKLETLGYGRRVCVILGLAIFVELRLVTYRQTDGQTDKHMMAAYTALAERRAVMSLSANKSGWT